MTDVFDETIPNGFRDMDSKIRSEHRNVDNYLRAKPLGMVLRASEIFDSTHPRQISKGEGYRAWGWFIGLALSGLTAMVVLTYIVKFLLKFFD